MKFKIESLPCPVDLGEIWIVQAGVPHTGFVYYARIGFLRREVGSERIRYQTVVDAITDENKWSAHSFGTLEAAANAIVTYSSTSLRKEV